MDTRLLDILCCPLTKTPVRPLTKTELDKLNNAIINGKVVGAAGQAVSRALGAGLITQNGKRVYPVESDIPVMLADEAIIVPSDGEYTTVRTL